jgi:hypothetical protein
VKTLMFIIKYECFGCCIRLLQCNRIFWERQERLRLQHIIDDRVIDQQLGLKAFGKEFGGAFGKVFMDVVPCVMAAGSQS